MCKHMAYFILKAALHSANAAPPTVNRTLCNNPLLGLSIRLSDFFLPNTEERYLFSVVVECATPCKAVIGPSV